MTSYARRPPNAKVPWPSGLGSPEEPRKEAAPRQSATYVCDRDHAFSIAFAAEARPPAGWDCRCGAPARLEGAGEGDGGRTHLAAYPTVGNGRYERPEISPREQLRKRRSDDELEHLLREALTGLKRQRGGA